MAAVFATLKAPLRVPCGLQKLAAMSCGLDMIPRLECALPRAKFGKSEPGWVSIRSLAGEHSLELGALQEPLDHL